VHVTGVQHWGRDRLQVEHDVFPGPRHRGHDRLELTHRGFLGHRWRTLRHVGLDASEVVEPTSSPNSSGTSEVEVLIQVSLGRSNREAAEELGLLPNTVKSYLKTAMRKLEAKNRVQAITAAREAGLIR